MKKTCHLFSTLLSGKEKNIQKSLKTKFAKKRPTALVIQEPASEAMAKIATAQSGSDNSSLGVEGDKVKTYLTLSLLVNLLSSTTYLSIVLVSG